MTQREKKLVIVMGTALGLLGGYKLIATMVLEPREELKKQILAARQNKESLENRSLGEVSAQRNWRNHTQHTLAATSPNNKAQDLFRAEVIELLKKNGLPHANVQLRQPTAAQGSKNYRKGFMELPVGVDTEGQMNQLVGFLTDFYSLDYYVTVDKITLNPKEGEASLLNAAATPAPGGAKGGRKPGGAKNEGESNPRLKIQLELTTLTLPQAEKLPHVVYDKAKPPEKPLKRLHSVDTSEYALVDSRNPFHVWREKVVEVQQTAERTEIPPATKQDKPPPPVDLRKGAEKLVLTATIAFDNQPIAYVRDDAKLTDPPKQIGLNEPFDDGKLVLIHKTGVVARKPPVGAQPAQLFFYPLGKKFTEREELSADKHSDIFQATQTVLQQQVTAISRNPP